MLGVLVATANALRETGGQLSARAASPSLRRRLQITGLTDSLAVQPATTAEDLLEAVCHGAMVATDPDDDRIARALNERFTELGRNHPIPYSEGSGDTP